MCDQYIVLNLLNCVHILVIMDDTKKMLRAIINGQSVLKGELVGRIDKLEQKMDKKFEEVDKRFEKVDKRFDSLEKNLTERVDKIGKQVALILRTMLRPERSMISW